MKRFLVLLFLNILFLSPQKIFAQDAPTVTVINPIRGNELGHENQNLLPGLQAQWSVTKKYNISATWLWQFTALENTSLVDFAKSNMQHQEFGLFLEIDRNFAQKSGVQFRGVGPWYFSNGLLLASYDENERHKLIDTAFNKFKKTFGYYPTTVGAWWIGAASLNYMQQKYGITAALKAADQYNLDVYTIWGSPWTVPYVASKENESIPTENISNSAHVVMMQWAARDPLQGYGSDEKNGTFSTQDYELKRYDISYFNYLLSIFANKPNDQLVVGLENSPTTFFTPDSHYSKILEEVVKLQSEKKITIQTAKDFAQNFLLQNKTLAPTHIFLTKDFTTNDQSFWYISPQYQLSIQKKGSEISLVDLRNYAAKAPEEFALLPNSQGNLRVDTPALIDSATNPNQKIVLDRTDQPLVLTTKNNQTILTSGTTLIAQLNNNTAKIFAHGKPIIYSFLEKQTILSAFYFILIAYILYAFCFYFVTKNKKQSFFFLLSFIPLFIAYPYLQNYPLLFDRKQFVLSSLFLVPFLSIQTKLFLFQIIPLLILLIIHFLSYVSKKTFMYVLFLIGIIILFFHLPYFPLDHSTYKIIGTVVVGIFITVSSIAGFISWKVRTKKAVLFCILGVGTILLTIGLSLIFSRSVEILTPFEQNALQAVHAQKKPVIFLQPNTLPIYKAVRPLLFDNPKILGELANEKITMIKRDAKNNLVLPNETFTLVVPYYLGSEIHQEEIDRYHLQKIFDNMQIKIFLKK